MQTWNWLYNSATPFTWRIITWVIIKTAILFAAVNVLFALLDPLSALGKLSGYNWLFDGRQRLPYGENPDVAYNLSLYQLDAMFASHTLDDAGATDEFRVLVLGDSSIWGILLQPDDTLTGQLNAQDYQTATSHPVEAFNLGYPTMSLTKDLMLLDYAMRYDPDLIVWLFTLESFDQSTQLDPAIIQNNANRVQELIADFNLNLDRTDPRFVERAFWEKTLIERRRALANMLRLQYYGIPWSVTGIDQEYNDDYTPRAIDLEPNTSWHGFTQGNLETTDLAFKVLRAGIEIAGSTPILFINEPMLLSNGENSDIRYNAFYPRWAYDQYREQLIEEASQANWLFLDLWDYLPAADCYTDSAVHLTPVCSTRLAERIGAAITQIANTGTLTESTANHTDP